jgi:mannose-1-phosphate guanylyltransferase
MAGGSGERFWPLSTKERPKQLLPLISDKTMIRETVDRLNGLVAPDDIYVATNAIQFENLQKEIPEIPDKNIILEPAFRDTAGAILYSSTYIALRNDNPVIVVLASDHTIKNVPDFQRTIKIADELAKDSNKIITLGIKPTYPETGYGYIRITNNEIFSINENVRFVEKPSFEIAKSYLKDGHYLWNSGMFVFRYNSLAEEFKVHSLEHYKVISQLFEIISNNSGFLLCDLAKQRFEMFPKISIDFAIMEKSKNIICISSDFGWNDVGSFDTLYNNLITKNENFHSKSLTLREIESNRNLIISNEKDLRINIIGINDLIIIKAANELLILKKGSSSKIKELLKI